MAESPANAALLREQEAQAVEIILGMDGKIDGIQTVAGELKDDFTEHLKDYEAFKGTVSTLIEEVKSSMNKELENSMIDLRAEMRLNNFAGLIIGLLFVVVMVLSIIGIVRQKKADKRMDAVLSDLKDTRSELKESKTDLKGIQTQLSVLCDTIQTKGCGQRQPQASVQAPSIHQILTEANRQYSMGQCPWNKLSEQFKDCVKKVRVEFDGSLQLWAGNGMGEPNYVLACLGGENYLLPNLLYDDKVPMCLHFTGAIPLGTIISISKAAMVRLSPKGVAHALELKQKGEVLCSSRCTGDDMLKALMIADSCAFDNREMLWQRYFTGIPSLNKYVVEKLVMVADGNVHLTIEQAGPQSTAVAVVEDNTAWIYPSLSNVNDPLIAKLFKTTPFFNSATIRRVLKPAKAVRRDAAADWLLTERGQALI